MTARPQPLDPDFAELIARRFGALAEPTRLRLLDALRVRGEASVRELSEALEAGEANVSKHLHVLLDQRIVGRRRDGTRVMYRIADQTVLALCEQVCGALEQQLRELEALVNTAARGHAWNAGELSPSTTASLDPGGEAAST